MKQERFVSNELKYLKLNFAISLELDGKSHNQCLSFTMNLEMFLHGLREDRNRIRSKKGSE
jgi:hypothetical protein